jgi:hypothetical protein
MKRQLFFGGIPAQPDVDKLRRAFPDSRLLPGYIIPYAEIEKIINVPASDSRFRSVTNKWRREIERETNKIIGVNPGSNFVVLSESEKVDLSGRKLNSAARAAKRSYVIIARTDLQQLTDEERARVQHQTDFGAKILASAQIRSRLELPILKKEEKHGTV